MAVVWAPQAVADVSRIVSYVAMDNPVAAAQIARELLLTADSLALFPSRGRGSLVPGLREIVAVRPYVMVYRLGPGVVVNILRVWHAAQER